MESSLFTFIRMQNAEHGTRNTVRRPVYMDFRNGIEGEVNSVMLQYGLGGLTGFPDVLVVGY